MEDELITRMMYYASYYTLKVTQWTAYDGLVFVWTSRTCFVCTVMNWKTNSILYNVDRSIVICCKCDYFGVENNKDH